jgi:hypothetical protein
MERRISFYDDQMPIQDCETLSVPKLNKRTLSKQILARWLRLAFPTYIIVLFTLSMYIYLGSGPAFYNVINFNIISPLEKNWWTIMLFVQNFLPPNTLPGLYWIHFVANDLQFYALVMMPSIYLYHNRNRWFVLGYLTFLIAFSTVYIFYMCWSNGFSSMLNVSDNKMFDYIFRAPFGPVGYYALGILLSIFYFEYSQAISNKQLRKRTSYKVMAFIG